MQYISLYKKFFISDDNGQKDYQDLFSNPTTLHFDISINGYPAFLVMNNEMIKLIENIEHLNYEIIKQVIGNKDIPEGMVHQMIKQTFIEEVRMTNQIEGITSTKQEITSLMNHPRQYKRLFGIVHQYNELILHQQDIFIKDSLDIKHLYEKTLLYDIKKENPSYIPDGDIFRKDLVEVVSGGTTIHKGLYPESKIIETMNKALDILNHEDYSFFIRIAVFHYLFGFIHPYYDGNGRLSRLISSSYLSKHLHILSALQLSISCQQHQKQYDESFKITSDIRNKGDLTYFVINFLEIIESGLKNLYDNIVHQCEQYQHYHQLIQTRHTKDKYENLFLDLLLQSSLYDEELTLNDFIEVTKLAKDTIKKRLKYLEQDHLILVNKKNKQYLYSFDTNAFDKKRFDS